jgi:hypothetical protein
MPLAPPASPDPQSPYQHADPCFTVWRTGAAAFMETGSERLNPRQQFFVAKAEQAEAFARECKEPLACESWVAVAKIWRLLADNSAEEFRL